MTISVEEYFETRIDDRKKEVRYINVINKDSCTSCQSCATVCPVDCIFEVPSPIPGQSYHQIDTSRCIGCQMCYRSPNDSTDLYQLTICPWNAIDMLHNPNMKPDEVSCLEPYWKGAETDLPYPKLEEYGYQFYLDGQVFFPAKRDDLLSFVDWFTKPNWLFTQDGDTVALVQEAARDDQKVEYIATEEGRALFDCMFSGWQRIFMD